MPINSYMVGIGTALGLTTDRGTEYFTFCRLLKDALMSRSGHMPKVLDQIMAQQGYDRSQIPEYLLRYLSDAGLKDGAVCDELKSFQV